MGTPLLGISGLGSIGGQHLRAAASRGDIRIAAFDPSEDLRVAHERLPAVESVHASYQDLLDTRPDALIIAGPDHVHLPQLAMATNAGVTALVEKPLAPTYADALAVAAELRATGVPILVGYVLRHRSAVVLAHQLVTSGEIGTPTSYQVMLGAYTTIVAAHSRFSREEPNRLYRDYSHEWDYLRWFFGPVTRGLAHARSFDALEHVERPNIVDGLLEHDTGVAGAFHLDYVEPHGLRTIHVIGTEGSLFADIGRGTVTVRHGDRDQVFVRPEPPVSALRRQADHLLDVAAGTAAPAVGLEDGIAALAVVEALIRSAETHSWCPVS